MPLMADVFSSNPGWDYIDLSDSLNTESYVPQLITSMPGLFQEEGVSGRRLAVEKRNETYNLVPYRVPGDVTNSQNPARASLYDFDVPHNPYLTAITPDQLSMVREFGSTTETLNLESVRARHMRIHQQNLSATEEYHRLAALRGFMLNADGSTYLNVYTAFGETQASEIDFTLAAADAADLDAKIDTVHRNMQDALDGTPLQGNIVALCGDTFFSSFKGHTGVRAAFLEWANMNVPFSTGVGADGQRGDFARMNFVYRQFQYQGIIWINYRGTLSGQTFVAADKAYFFPIGVPGLFISRWAPPSNRFETVNTVGRPRYMFPNLETDSYGDRLELQSEMNGIHLCTRPQVLQSAGE